MRDSWFGTENVEIVKSFGKTTDTTTSTVADNVTGAEANVFFDKTPPAAPTVAGVSAGLKNASQAFTLAGEEKAKLEYSLDGGTTWSAYAEAVTVANEGAYTLVARQTDLAGNVSANSAALAFTLDKTAPAAPTVAGISAGSFNVDKTFTLTGVESGASAQYSTDNGTTWSAYSTGVTLSAEGSYTVIARQTDAAGNVSANSASVAVTLDKTPPAAPAIAGIAAGAYATAQPFTVTGAEQGATVQYSTDGGTTWTAYAGSATTPADEGNYTLTARQTDAAGNVSVNAASVAVAIDKTAPTVALSDDKGQTATFKQGDVVTITATFTDAGGIDETNAPKITIENGGVTAAAMTKSTNLVWTYAWTVPAGEASATVSIAAKDKVGNANQAATGGKTYAIDNTPPAAPAIAGITAGIKSENQTFTVTGAEQGATVQYSTSGGTTWTTYASDVTLSAEGSYTITARQTDAAGNVSANAASVAITIALPKTLAQWGAGNLHAVPDETGLNYYVVSGTTHSVFKMTRAGMATLIAGAGTYGDADGTGNQAKFNSPKGLVRVGTTLYVCDNGNNKIRKILADGTVTTLASGLTNPECIAAAANGDFYVGCGWAAKVVKVTAGGVVSDFYKTGLYNVPGLEVDANGNIVVVDSGYNQIRRIAPDGLSSTVVAGSGMKGFVNNSNAAQATFSGLSDVAVTDFGFFVADYDNNCIRKIDLSGAVTTYAGLEGSPGITDGDGTLINPIGIKYDANNRGFVVTLSGGTNLRFVGIP